MNMPQSAKYALGVAAAAALLAGCSSGASSSFAPTGNGPATAAGKIGNLNTSTLNPKLAAHIHQVAPGQTHPIVVPAAKNTPVVFISSFYGGVDQYNSKTGKYIGSLPQPPEGFSGPQGLCTDKAGNVWVSNTNNLKLDEYSAAGAYMTSLSDAGGYPVGCAVSSKGTLIATNIFNASEGTPGNIQVFTNESGAGKTVATIGAGINRAFLVGFVSKSETAWFSGENVSYGAAFAQYKGGKVSSLTISGATIGFPGTVTYSTKTKSMVVGDQDTFYGPTFYQVNPKTATVTGSTVLACSSGFCDVDQAAIKGGSLAGPDASSNVAAVYKYPAGGAGKALSGGSPDEPVGSAFSVVK
jgi:hypothetical protein